jgi:two-component system, NarL family, nitrate/nitrite response regulator NarL
LPQSVAAAPELKAIKQVFIMAVRVAILSVIRLYAEGLAEYLNSRGDISVIGIARNFVEISKLIEAKPVDLVLCDTSEKELAEEVRQLSYHFNEVRIIAVALTETETEVVTWVEAGVSGYVPRHASLAQLHTAMLSAMRGELRCSPRITGWLLRELRPDRSPPGERLTSREIQTLRLISQGLSNKEIARELGISISTVKNHVHSVLEKLRVQSRSQAAARIATYDFRLEAS